ncbi:SMP-30/gluconolactonase/LRE family protein [Aureimonas sp. AU22]|uniref:SMP-30/gluconolactonase/LRE family protein n=1 Tax=Aureimonas sp. AU22 TaxID=1638162 RepID=UPI0009E7C34D|nr:SMP-30/gluconolactonase/LRE family protein [Aureimonas sp. AU22]
MIDVELVCRAGALNGEGPVWSVCEERLYWVDIRAPALHRFDPATGRNETWAMPTWIGCLALAEPGHVVVALRTGLHRFDTRSGALAFLAPVPFDPRRFAFNDGGCDPVGRFLAGTMLDPLDPAASDEGEAATPLWRYEGDDTWIGVTPAVETSNGLAWSPDGRTMYHSDTARKTVWRYDYDTATGAAENGRVFAEVKDGAGPDGAAVDADGFYLCAVFGGGCLLRFDPDGRLERRIAMPAKFVTMPAFGGSDLSTLFVTSASFPVPQAERAARPNEGALFAMEAPARGIATRRMSRHAASDPGRTRGAAFVGSRAQRA